MANFGDTFGKGHAGVSLFWAWS